jgi:hypothetical protein
MTRFRLMRTRWLFGVLLLLSLGLLPQPLPAQQEPSVAPAVESSVATKTDVPAGATDQGLGDVFGDNTCHPPSTQEWVFIALGTLGIFILSFLGLVRPVQRYYIRRDRNATYGRHVGISWTFFVSAIGMVPLAYLVTHCLHRQFLVWTIFPLALWLIHLIYTLAVLRHE